MFSKDETISFEGGKGEDAYDFLTLSYEMLEAVGLMD